MYFFFVPFINNTKPTTIGKMSFLGHGKIPRGIGVHHAQVFKRLDVGDSFITPTLTNIASDLNVSGTLSLPGISDLSAQIQACSQVFTKDIPIGPSTTSVAIATITLGLPKTFASMDIDVTCFTDDGQVAGNSDYEVVVSNTGASAGHTITNGVFFDGHEFTQNTTSSYTIAVKQNPTQVQKAVVRIIATKAEGSLTIAEVP